MPKTEREDKLPQRTMVRCGNIMRAGGSAAGAARRAAIDAGPRANDQIACIILLLLADGEPLGVRLADAFAPGQRSGHGEPLAADRLGMITRELFFCRDDIGIGKGGRRGRGAQRDRAQEKHMHERIPFFGLMSLFLDRRIV